MSLPDYIGVTGITSPTAMNTHYYLLAGVYEAAWGDEKLEWDGSYWYGYDSAGVKVFRGTDGDASNLPTGWLGMITVTGTLSPDVTGEYLYDSEHNSEPVYTLNKLGVDWYVWYDTGSTRWYLTTEIGTISGFRWYCATLAGSWTAEGGVA